MCQTSSKIKLRVMSKLEKNIERSRFIYFVYQITGES